MVDAIKVVTKYLVCDFSRAGVFQGFKTVFDIIAEMTHLSFTADGNHSEKDCSRGFSPSVPNALSSSFRPGQFF